jgi:predicted nucleotidyltransferase
MINRKRDYSEEIADLCKRHNVKYLGLHGSSYDQENIGAEDPDINFLVEFFPMETEQYSTRYFGLEKDLQDLFGPQAGILDIGDIKLPELLRMLTRRKTDIYKTT